MKNSQVIQQYLKKKKIFSNSVSCLTMFFRPSSGQKIVFKHETNCNQYWPPCSLIYTHTLALILRTFTNIAYLKIVFLYKVLIRWWPRVQVCLGGHGIINKGHLWRPCGFLSYCQSTKVEAVTICLKPIFFNISGRSDIYN